MASEASHLKDVPKSVISLAAAATEETQILVKRLTDEEPVKLGVKPQSTVEDLKNLIHESLGVSPSEQKILFCETQLANDATPIEEYGIKHGTLLTLLVVEVPREEKDRESADSSDEEAVLDDGAEHRLLIALRAALSAHLDEEDFRGPNADNGPCPPRFFCRKIMDGDVAKTIMRPSWTGSARDREGSEEFALHDRLAADQMDEWFEDTEGPGATQALLLLNRYLAEDLDRTGFTYVRFLDGNSWSFGLGVAGGDGYAVGFRASPVMF